MNPNLDRTLKNILYTLKHQYGDSVDIYHLENTSTDFKTGEKTNTISKRSSRHAIVLPIDVLRKFFQGITYIAESRAFASQGGPGWDQETTGFIFDDLDYEFQPEDWIIYKNKRYDVNNIQDIGQGYLVVCKHARGSNADQIIEVNAVTTLNAKGVANGP